MNKNKWRLEIFKKTNKKKHMIKFLKLKKQIKKIQIQANSKY